MTIIQHIKKTLKNPVVITHLAMIPVALITFYFQGLMAATLAMIAMSTALILWLKGTKKPIDTLVWIEFGLLMAFGLPGVLLNNPLMIKLQETISGLIMGLGFFALSFFRDASVVKSLIPGFVYDFCKKWEYTDRLLSKTPDKTWKQIDYLWALEMTLSAAISMAIALTMPTAVWFYAKYMIAPILVTFTFAIQGTMMHRATRVEERLVPDALPRVEAEHEYRFTQTNEPGNRNDFAPTYDQDDLSGFYSEYTQRKNDILCK